MTDTNQEPQMVFRFTYDNGFENQDRFTWESPLSILVNAMASFRVHHYTDYVCKIEVFRNGMWSVMSEEELIKHVVPRNWP